MDLIAFNTTKHTFALLKSNFIQKIEFFAI